MKYILLQTTTVITLIAKTLSTFRIFHGHVTILAARNKSRGMNSMKQGTGWLPRGAKLTETLLLNNNPLKRNS
jgi:hypothetical protein